MRVDWCWIRRVGVVALVLLLYWRVARVLALSRMRSMLRWLGNVSMMLMSRGG